MKMQAFSVLSDEMKEVPINESENHTRLPGVQAAQLQHQKEQEKRPGQA
jgi:hypothetical protein